MIVRLTSAGALHGLTEGKAAEIIDQAHAQHNYDVDFHNQRAYIWKDNELLADAALN